MGRSKKCKEAAQSTDLFGHAVSLNFNGKGDRHVSWLTTVMSILIRISMTVYLGSRFYLFHEGSKTQTSLDVDLIDFDEVGELKPEGQLFNFFSIIGNNNLPMSQT